MKKLRILLLSTAVFCALGAKSQANDIVANIQNESVNRYINEVVYINRDDDSRVADYVVSDGNRLDLPLPAVVEVPERYVEFINYDMISMRYCFDGSFAPEATYSMNVANDELGASIYDLQPGVTCFYKMYLLNMLIKWGELTTKGPVRMLNLSSVRNVRDLGGWETIDGRTIKYGKLIRGSELNGLHVADANDIQHLLDLGVTAELDLRGDYEEGHGVSAFGFKDSTEVEGNEIPSYLYTNDSGQLPAHMRQSMYLQRWRQEFEFIVDNLTMDRTIYFHCRHGADRTGYLSLLLEGLLGVPYGGLMKDYELTSFADMDKKKEDLNSVMVFIEKLDGETLQEKFNTFWTKRVGVKQEDVDYFINEMLDGKKPGSDVVTSIAPIQQSVSCTNYDLTGRRVSACHRGLIISRQNDGSVKKIMKPY